uniref:Actin-related protein 10-like n=1 Tax=Sinocyclocheilus anshuiensis TaxID=1608454 RepID=A0A671T1X4_9TELE
MPLFEGLGSGGEKTAVVVDLGAAYTKCGFAGETGPRFIIPSEVKRAGSPEVSLRTLMGIISISNLLLKTFLHVFLLQVPSVLFAPSHLMSVMTLGIQSALVMDCGYTETLVLPESFDSVPILSAWEALPMGGKAIHRELHSLLSEQCTLDTDSGTGLSLPTVISSIPEDVVEDIKVRVCFVSDLQRGMKIQEAKFNMDGSAERPAPPPDVEYPLGGRKILHIKGSIRDSVAEMLFEQDNEEKSIATLLLDTLVKCPIDTRKVLSENVVIIGGTAMLPGFLHRLLSEIRSLVEKPKYCDALATKSFRIHSPPAKPNCTAWLGGAIFGALQDILGSRSVSRDYYNQMGRIPDWCCLSTPLPDSVYEAGKTPPPLMKRAFSTEK